VRHGIDTVVQLVQANGILGLGTLVDLVTLEPSD
jgi:hypothetical protein